MRHGVETGCPTMSKAEQHYARWSQITFHPERLYYGCGAATMCCAFALCLVVANLTQEEFSYRDWLVMSAVFGPLTCIAAFAARIGAVGGAWIVANQAMQFWRSGQLDHARHFLLARYRGVHPIVINDPSVRAMLWELNLAVRPASELVPDASHRIAAKANWAVVGLFSALVLWLAFSALRLIF